MTSELVVDVQPKEVSIALLEDKSLVELQSEGRNISFSVGNMYLGRIKKLMPGLNACFVDVGYEKDAFLHYLDLGPQFNSLEKFVKQTLSDKKKLTSISKATLLPDLDKDGTVSNTLKVGQEVVVQIVKEPISTKGPRLTSEISFAGRYLVLIPFNDKVSVSQKIKSSEERARLKQLLMSIKPKNFGVIVRTVAEGKRVAELDGELKVLVKHWEDAMVKVQKATKYPTLIYEETTFFVEEDKIITALFEEGLDVLHLRKPETPAMYSERLLTLIPDKYHRRIVTHEHFYLKEEFNLMGIHLNARNPKEPHDYYGHISCSCHSVEEVKNRKHFYDYVFMSPIYDSISKVNYYSTYTAEELREAQRAKIIDSKVMALGGINEDNLLEIKDFGFGGAVVLGDLWNRFDACQDQNYLAVIEHFKKLKKLSD